MAPDSLAMAMPPPTPAIELEPPVKVYVPLLPLMLMPVEMPLVVTLPLKLMVFELPPEIETARPAFAWLMLPPQEIVPPLPPVTLNVGPVAPVSEPPAVPHVPVTPLRFTPLVSPVELTLLNVPLTAPGLRLRAMAPETLPAEPIARVPKLLPLMPVVGPLMVRPLNVVMEVPSVDSEMPVVPPLIVPPLIVTLPLPSEASATPVAAPVVLTEVKVAPEAPTGP